MIRIIASSSKYSKGVNEFEGFATLIKIETNSYNKKMGSAQFTSKIK